MVEPDATSVLLSPVFRGWWLMLVLVALGVAVLLALAVTPFVTYWAYHRVVDAGDDRGGDGKAAGEAERGERAREDA